MGGWDAGGGRQLMILQLLHVDELEPADPARALPLPDAAGVLPNNLDQVPSL